MGRTGWCCLMKKGHTLREIKKHRNSYLMVAPYMLLFTVFTVIPVIAAVALSFTSFNMMSMPKFVGWDNYVRMILDDEVFLIAVKNTLIFAVITGPISFVACFLFAWLINMFSPGLRSLLTFVFYAPSITGNAYIIWTYIFSGDMYGMANATLMRLGIIDDPVQWFTDPRYNLTLIIIVQLWLSLGSGFLAFIAGLQGVERSLYEAGAIDGIKNRVQELLYITLPSMGPQLQFAAVIQIAGSFAAGKICSDLAGFPSTDYSAHTIVTHIMDYGNLRYELGYACALGTVLSIAMLLVNGSIRKLLRKHTNA